MQDEAREIVAEFDRIEGFKALSRLCYDYFVNQGVIQFSYSHFPPIGAMDFGRINIITWLGYPAPWVEAFSRAGFVDHDPVAQRLAKTTRAVWMSEMNISPDLSGAEQTYFDLRRKYNVPDDLCVPVFGPSGRNGVYGIGYSDDVLPISKADVVSAQWICQNAHIRYCELLEEKIDHIPALSKRERQVLQSIARGKTNSQIAADLSVTVKTIDTYLARVFQKLDVHDRMTAALRAIAMGIID